MSSQCFMAVRFAAFIAELFIAELMFCRDFKKRKLFYLRFIGGAVCLLGFSFPLAVVTFNLFQAFNFNAAAEMLVSFLACSVLFCLSLTVLLLSFKENYKKIMLCGILGYSSQHLIFCTYSLIVKLMGEEFVLFNYEPVNVWKFVIYFLTYIIMYLCVWFLLASRLRAHERESFGRSTYLLFGIMILFNTFVGRAAETLSPESRMLYVMCLVCQIGICLFILFVQIYSLQQMREKHEKQLVEQLLSQKESQYESIKRNTEQLSIRLHDMKYLMRDIPRQELEETQALIEIFSGTSDTGNEIIDVVLNEKQNLCREKGVSLSCMADGKALSFMKPADVYALIGNALDNALEAVSQCGQAEKKVISFNLKLQQGVVCMQVENYFENPLKYSDGELVSTKRDGGLHGYGIKSIRYIAEKYGGSARVQTEDSVFTLTVNIPFKE